MPEGLLSKALGVSRRLRPLCPGVTIRMERNAPNLKGLAAPVEFGRPVVCAEGRKLREKRTGVWELAQQRSKRTSDYDGAGRSCFLPGKGDSFLTPVHILGLK